MKIYIFPIAVLFFLPYSCISSDTITLRTGFIEGNAVWPGEGMPCDMRVYAENLESTKVYMTKFYEYTNPEWQCDGTTYRIEVPEGKYLVYAMTDRKKGFKAYYSEFVKCGYTVKCNSHIPLVVTVEANKTIGNIDPGDWYHD